MPKKKHRVPELLWRLFRDRACPLSETIVSLLPPPPSPENCLCKGLHCLGCSADPMSFLLRPGDSSDYRKLLTHCFVVVSDNAPSLSLFIPQSRWSQSEIVRRTIEMMACGKEPVSELSNVLCSEYVKRRCFSPTSELLSCSPWDVLLSRVGDDLMIYLLRNTSIFLPVSHMKYRQVAGPSVTSLCFKMSKCSSKFDSRTNSLPQGEMQKKRKRTGDIDSTTGKRKCCISVNKNDPAIHLELSLVNIKQSQKGKKAQIMLQGNMAPSKEGCLPGGFHCNETSLGHKKKMLWQCPCCMILQSVPTFPKRTEINRRSIFYNSEPSSSVLPKRHILNSLSPNLVGSEYLIRDIYGISEVDVKALSTHCFHKNGSCLTGSVCLYHSLVRWFKHLIRRSHCCQYEKLLEKHCAVPSCDEDPVGRSSSPLQSKVSKTGGQKKLHGFDGNQCMDSLEAIDSQHEAVKSYCSISQRYSCLDEVAVRNILRGRVFGFSKLRLRPKENGVRMVANLSGSSRIPACTSSRKVSFGKLRKENAYKKKYDYYRSVNYVLRDAHIVLKDIQFREPEKLGSSVFDYNDYDQVVSTKKSLWVRKFFSVLDENISIGYERFTSPASFSSRHNILVDKGIVKHVENKVLLSYLKQHVKNNILQLEGKFYLQGVGIPQGAGFFSRLQRGFRDYNCYMNEKKFGVNFDVGQMSGSSGRRVHVGEDGTSFLCWSGLLINRSTLEVQADYTKYLNGHLRSTLTVCWQGKPGLSLKEKLCAFLRPKCHPIFFDLNINSAAVVRLNVYQAFLLCAMKFHCYICELSIICQLHKRVCLKSIERSISYLYGLIKKRMHSMAPRCNFRPILRLEKDEVEWLGLHAYVQSMHQIPLSFGISSTDFLQQLKIVLFGGLHKNWKYLIRDIYGISEVDVKALSTHCFHKNGSCLTGSVCLYHSLVRWFKHLIRRSHCCQYEKLLEKHCAVPSCDEDPVGRSSSPLQSKVSKTGGQKKLHGFDGNQCMDSLEAIDSQHEAVKSYCSISQRYSCLDEVAVRNILRGRVFGFSKLRLRPKENGVRMVANLSGSSRIPACTSSRKVSFGKLRKENAYKKKYDYYRSVNYVLRDAHIVLKDIQFREPEKLGSSVFDYNDYDQVVSTKKSLWVRKFFSVLDENISIGYERFTSPASFSSRHNILVDKGIVKHVENKVLLSYLKQHVKNNILQLEGKFYLQGVGIPQGAGFFSRLQRGFRDYNCYMNEKKFGVNFDVGQMSGSSGRRVHVGEDGTSFLCWSGLLINRSTLEVQADYTKYLNGHLRSTLTVCWQGKPGLSLKEKLCAFLRPKCHPIFFDLNINSAAVVRLNVYQAFLLCAMKFHCYICELSIICQLHKRVCLKSIERSISYLYGLIKKRMHSMAPRCNFRPILRLEKDEVEWLGLHAYVQSMHQIPLSFGISSTDFLQQLKIVLFGGLHKNWSGWKRNLARCR
ncbi:hypothetical protein K1719_023926 [Acacia pycnantha]|nr:hypothetical protein K1719_023926 [Acacia pycnantha]